MPMDRQWTSAGAKESLTSGEADLESDDMAVPLMLPPAVDRSSRNCLAGHICMSTVARLPTSRYHRAICTSSFTYPNIEPPSPPDDENELVQTPTTQQGSHDTTQDKMSLWGTKKDNDGEDEHLHVNGESETDAAPRASHDDARPRSSRSRREPNERDRLLGAHNPPHSDGYLDPDDPAV